LCFKINFLRDQIAIFALSIAIFAFTIVIFKFLIDIFFFKIEILFVFESRFGSNLTSIFLKKSILFFLKTGFLTQFISIFLKIPKKAVKSTESVSLFWFIIPLNYCGDDHF